MKKFLLYVLSVATMTVALLGMSEIINRYLIFSSSGSNPYKMYRLFVEQPTGEIPIFGSSRAETGFAPKELSEKAFNYGLSGSLMRETVFHLKAAVNRKEKAAIIVNLDPWGLGNGPFRGEYRFVSSSPLVRKEPKVKLELIDRIPGIRFQGEMRRNIAEYMNNQIAVTKTMECGAILQRLSRSASEWEYIISNVTPTSFVRNEETVKLLANVLNENQNHEIVFVVSPVSDPWWKLFKGKEQLVQLEDWLSKFPHVHIIDYMSLGVNYDLSEFMDLTHLNEHGARRFTRELRDKLKSLKLL